MDKSKIALAAALVGGGVFFVLNITTQGAVPGGFQGGMIGGILGYGLAWLVLAFIPTKK